MRILTLLAALVAATPALALEGQVTKVRDADTIVVDGTPIRLNGVDAPELKTPYGKPAKRAMQALVDGQHLTCEVTGAKSYDREIGVCFLADGRDVGAEIIRQGHALDCPKFSKGRYRDLEPAHARDRLAQAKYCKVK